MLTSYFCKYSQASLFQGAFRHFPHQHFVLQAFHECLSSVRPLSTHGLPDPALLSGQMPETWFRMRN